MNHLELKGWLSNKYLMVILAWPPATGSFLASRGSMNHLELKGWLSNNYLMVILEATSHRIISGQQRNHRPSGVKGIAQQ
jgi:hypothetical protein